jgi:hypothetical protein
MATTDRPQRPTRRPAHRSARQTAPPPGAQRSAPTTEHSPKRLRDLLRASPLIAPELRAHWLRVLPHLAAEQRAELATLLEAGIAAGGAAGRADAPRP